MSANKASLSTRHESESYCKTVALYDGGAWFVVWIFFGIPAFLGSIVDYFWNFFVLRFTLTRLGSGIEGKHGKYFTASDLTGTKLQMLYTLVITVFGLVIDFIYFDIGWGFNWDWVPNFNVPGLFHRGSAVLPQVAWTLVPVFAIALVNFAASRLWLHLSSNDALIVAGAMGLFTAPWLILVLELLSAVPH
jgi:hypothetical protein